MDEHYTKLFRIIFFFHLWKPLEKRGDFYVHNTFINIVIFNGVLARDIGNPSTNIIYTISRSSLCIACWKICKKDNGEITLEKISMGQVWYEVIDTMFLDFIAENVNLSITNRICCNPYFVFYWLDCGRNLVENYTFGRFQFDFVAAYRQTL